MAAIEIVGTPRPTITHAVIVRSTPTLQNTGELVINRLAVDILERFCGFTSGQ